MIWWFEIHGIIYSKFLKKNHKERHTEKRKEKYYLLRWILHYESMVHGVI
jgi:hypothetical protein